MTSALMHRVVADSFGPVEDLRVQETAVPEPGDAQVLIEVVAAGVGFVDGLLVQGLYQVKPPLPYVPGTVVSGVVLRCGPGAVGFREGDRVVATGPVTGGFATHAVADEINVAHLPEAVGHERAAGMVESWSTMLFAFTRRARVDPGARVLVLGAGGGVGLAAVDIASSMGAEVIAAASNDQKLALAQRVGAAHLVNYSETDLRKAVRDIAPDGVDLVVDPVGGDFALSALRCLARYGSHLVLGFASGDIPRLGANRILLENHTVTGVDFGDACRTDPAVIRPVLDELFQMAVDGLVSPPDPHTYPLGDAGRALASLAARSVSGKLVLLP